MIFFSRWKRKKCFNEKLKSRTKSEWLTAWSGYCLREVKVVCKVLQYHMRYSSFYFLPNDSFSDIFLGEDCDFSDIAAIFEIEFCLDKTVTFTSELKDIFTQCSVSNC